MAPLVSTTHRLRAFPPLGGHGGKALRVRGDERDVEWAELEGGGGGDGGVTAVGALDGQAKSANGLVIVGNQVFAQSADPDAPGLLTNADQWVLGRKTFGDWVNTNWLNTWNIFAAGTDAGTGDITDPEDGNRGSPLVLWGGQDGGASDSSAAVIVRNSDVEALTGGYLLRWANGGAPPTHNFVGGVTYDGQIEAAGFSAPNIGGLLYSSVVDAGASNTLTNSTLEDFFTYTLPANSLRAGEGLRFNGAVFCVGTNVRKRLRLVIGSTTMADHDLSSAAVWLEFTGTLYRQTGGTNTWRATIQRFAYTSASSSQVSGHDVTAGTESFSSSIVVKLQAGITAAAGSITGIKFTVEKVALR